MKKTTQVFGIGLINTDEKTMSKKQNLNYSPMEIIHRLLYLSLIEIRAEYSEEKPNMKKIFHLSDLFHNIPLRLKTAIEGNDAYFDILTSIKKRAEQKGCTGWLEHALEKNLNISLEEVFEK